MVSGFLSLVRGGGTVGEQELDEMPNSYRLLVGQVRPVLSLSRRGANGETKLWKNNMIIG